MTAARRIDLHTHSLFSDGTTRPAEVVRRAHARGVEALALSDHDSVDGFAEAGAEALRLGLRLFCAVEINTREGDNTHILGYGLDPSSAGLRVRLEEFRSRRAERARRIVEKLRAASVDVSWEELGASPSRALGRPHVADALVRRGIVRSRREAFERYLSRGRPGYVEPMGPSVAEAISAVHEAGGWASLAHPGLAGEGDLDRWTALGLEGLEVYYPTHNAGTLRQLLELARDRRLLPTVGSDYHGPGTGREEIGCMTVESALFDRLLERLE